MADYDVNFQELRTASNEFNSIRGDVQGLLSTLQSVNLGPMDFGRGPGLGGLYSGYRKHAQDCTQTLQETGEAMSKTAMGLSATADIYQQVEENASQVADRFFGSAL